MSQDTNTNTGATADAGAGGTAVTIDPGASLGSIVTEHPKLIRELEKLGLDFCCGGHLSLADACYEAGLDTADVTTTLQSELSAGDEGPEAWADLELTALADHIEATHHQYLHTEFGRLQALADKVAGVHGARHPELVEVRDTYVELRDDLEPHMMKEEQVLFPLIRELSEASDLPGFHCGSVRNPIAVMCSEHESAGELLERLNELTGGYKVPDDGCASYQALYAGLAELESDLHLHIHKENNLLFPQAIAFEAALADQTASASPSPADSRDTQ